ncbi:hypothetical protein C900_01905 [Fulvivirga imtechensis AK7]|uniref:Uncharacterized protein n=1 Tax=Fulvivirga imtechensis AK7 TaxID=1237149 RepID=L8JT74_9BACT|nr:hypothetical protein C900_01905 [Fulvivirga imtechensis AK7]
MKAVSLLFFMTFSFVAYACPFCDSATAEEIRASLFGADLTFNLFVTILPFIIFSLIVYLIYHGGIPAKKDKANPSLKQTKSI